MTRSNTKAATTPIADLRRAWTSYKNVALKVFLAVGATFLVSAQFIPPLNSALSHWKFLGIGFVLAIAVLVLDVVMSPSDDPSSRSATAPLPHYSDLGEHLDDAFREQEVELDIASYSSETFYSVLTDFLSSVSRGDLRPRSLALRLLLPDCNAPMGVPCLVDSRLEDPEYKLFLVARTDRFVREFTHSFNRIKLDHPTIKVSFEVKMHRMSPLFKMIIINRQLAFFGIYPIDETPIALSGLETIFLDYRGDRTRMIGARRGSHVEAEEELFDSLRSWYEAVWSTVAK